MEYPTYVLVHGAWGGAWSWEKFTLDLDRRDVSWRTLDLPSSEVGADPTSDLQGDADVVAEVANGVGGPVILVGHSYAGAVITQASASIPNIELLIFIAGTVPQVGESHSDCARLLKVKTLMDKAIKVEGDMLLLDPKLAPLALYQEATPEDRAWAAEQLSTQTLASFKSPRTTQPNGVRSRYILCRNDHALDPSIQELMAQRCDAVVEIESDHCPFLSHPMELARAVLA
jgi:pimeloyl-ACP methyl ester carboxylesterase